MDNDRIADASPSIEQRIASAILSRIRKHRKENLPRRSAPAGDSVAVTAPKLRLAQFSDFEAVREMKGRWGLIPDPFENWERLWRRNPALERAPTDVPIGWVLEAEGRVVGYLGNIPLLYQYGDRQLLAVTGHGMVVEPIYRTASLALMAPFFRQKFADLYLTTTAIAAVGKIMQIFKAERIPQANYETVLFWVLQPFPFAQAIIDGMDLKPSLLPIARMVASAAVGTDKTLRRRWPKQAAARFSITEIGVSEIGDDFQSLWIAKLKEEPRVLADRSPAVLKWHFETPGEQGTTRVFCCRVAEELRGYMVVRNNSQTENGLRKSIVADALIKDDDPEVIQALFAAAYRHAKDAGSHVLEVLGFPQSIRQVCAQWSPYQRRYPSCPFFFKAAEPVLHRELSNSALWYATPFDGDTTLMP